MVYGMEYLALSTCYMNTRILQSMVSGIPLVLSLRTRTWIPMFMWSLGVPTSPRLEFELSDTRPVSGATGSREGCKVSSFSLFFFFLWLIYGWLSKL